MSAFAKQAQAATQDKTKKLRNVYLNLGGVTALRFEVWEKPMREGSDEFNDKLKTLDPEGMKKLLTAVLASPALEIEIVELSNKDTSGTSDAMAAILAALI